ncbi:hypothetical protein [Streptomyces xantholiticus]|uniref:Uncharacterized protein n=1 Tax=Streptomyces xantholiticus TaxID=68285 RepID=A0ABV1V4P6_9ACTN
MGECLERREEAGVPDESLTAGGRAGSRDGLFVTSGQAHAATWTSSTSTNASSKDPGGIDAYSNLMKDGKIYYGVLFQASGEWLAMADSLADGHAARAEVIVVDQNGKFMDSDTFYASTADGAVWLNLGAPDGTGDIPEGYEVRIGVCINETTTCPGGSTASPELDSVGDLGVSRYGSVINGHARGCSKGPCDCRGVRCPSVPVSVSKSRL